MNIQLEQIRGFRLRAHHLDMKIPMDALEEAAGACGVQNSPPGTWETAMFNRLKDGTLELVRDALYKKKVLLQAWSVRGVPMVFPTQDSEVFLSSLIAREGEEPWIYTRGITAALDFIRMDFDQVLALVKKAAEYLDDHVILSKETLDQRLAEIVEKNLPTEKLDLWRSPSMYGRPDRQTVGGAAVSFLLRPCSFYSLVVFGCREGIHPTFTSYRNWIGQERKIRASADERLVRKFLHCYGPSTPDCFQNWLGASTAQAKRLWDSVKEEMQPVFVGKKRCYMLTEDMKNLLLPVEKPGRLMLLGPHDPYLDMRDRTVILENKARHRAVWTTVSNPGVVLKDGHIIGIWKTKTQRDKLEVLITLYEELTDREKKQLTDLGEEYAAFRRLSLKNIQIQYPSAVLREGSGDLIL